MKMQTNILAPADGTVAEVLAGVGEALEQACRQRG